MYYTFDGILWILKDHRRVTSSNVTFEVINNSPVESFTFVCEDENTYTDKIITVGHRPNAVPSLKMAAQ